MMLMLHGFYLRGVPHAWCRLVVMVRQALSYNIPHATRPSVNLTTFSLCISTLNLE